MKFTKSSGSGHDKTTVSLVLLKERPLFEKIAEKCKKGLEICTLKQIDDLATLSNYLYQRTQRLAARLATGIHHLPYEEKLQRLGLHSL